MRIERSLFDVYYTTLYIYAQVRFVPIPYSRCKGILVDTLTKEYVDCQTLLSLYMPKISNIINCVVGSQHIKFFKQ